MKRKTNETVGKRPGLQAGADIQQLTRVLAWAAQEGLPFDEALEAMQPSPGKRILTMLAGSPVIGGPLALLFYRRSRHYIALGRAIARLREGLALSEALQAALGRRLPDYYLPALREAEDLDMLPEVLSHLADQNVEAERIVATGWAVYLTFYLAAASLIILPFLIFIAPKFAHMAMEMNMGKATPWPVTIVIGADPAALYLLLGVGIVLALLVSWWILAGTTVFVRNLNEQVAMHLPWSRRRRRRFASLDLARSMQLALRGDRSMLEAVRWSCGASKSWWQQRRLTLLLELIESGVRWDRAWDQLELGGQAERWVLHLAAMREDPRGGFKLLADLLSEQLAHANRKFEIVARFIAVAVVAGVIGPVVFAIYAMITAMVMHAGRF